MSTDEPKTLEEWKAVAIRLRDSATSFKAQADQAQSE